MGRRKNPDSVSLKGGELASCTQHLVAGFGETLELVDPEAMAEGLERVYSDPRLRERYSKESRKFAELSDWNATVDRWAHLLG